jgi:quercetin dioxygenase-like cupin family protein
MPGWQIGWRKEHTMGKYVVKESDLPWQDRTSQARFKALGVHEKLAFILMRMDAGIVVPPHSHEAEEVGFILHGKGETQIGDERHTLGPGDYFFIPSNASHQIRVIEDMEFIGAMSPPRPEYRPASS